MKNRRITGVWAALTAVLALGLSSQALAAARGTILADTEVHRSPDSGSEVLGKLRSGTSVTLVSASKNGWYSMAFSRPVKGADKGWIKKENVRIERSGGASAARGSSRKSSHSSSQYTSSLYMGAEIGFLMGMNPAEYQTAIGLTGASASSLSFGVMAHYRLSDNLALGGDAFKISAASAAATGGSGITYNADGFIFFMALEYKIFNIGGSADVALGAGAGLTLVSAGNTSSAALKINTSNIMSPLFGGKIVVTVPLSDGSFLLKFDAGYRIISLSAVPYLVGSGTQQTGTAGMNLSSMYANLGIAFGF